MELLEIKKKLIYKTKQKKLKMKNLKNGTKGASSNMHWPKEFQICGTERIKLLFKHSTNYNSLREAAPKLTRMGHSRVVNILVLYSGNSVHSTRGYFHDWVVRPVIVLISLCNFFK